MSVEVIRLHPLGTMNVLYMLHVPIQTMDFHILYSGAMQVQISCWCYFCTPGSPELDLAVAPKLCVTFLQTLSQSQEALCHLPLWQAFSFTLCAAGWNLLMSLFCFPSSHFASFRRNLWHFHRFVRLHCEAAFEKCNWTTLLFLSCGYGLMASLLQSELA